MAKSHLIGKVAGVELGDLFEAVQTSQSKPNSNQPESSLLSTAVTVGFLVVGAALAYNVYFAK